MGKRREDLVMRELDLQKKSMADQSKLTLNEEDLNKPQKKMDLYENLFAHNT